MNPLVETTPARQPLSFDVQDSDDEDDDEEEEEDGGRDNDDVDDDAIYTDDQDDGTEDETEDSDLRLRMRAARETLFELREARRTEFWMTPDGAEDLNDDSSPRSIDL